MVIFDHVPGEVISNWTSELFSLLSLGYMLKHINRKSWEIRKIWKLFSPIITKSWWYPLHLNFKYGFIQSNNNNNVYFFIKYKYTMEGDWGKKLHLFSLTSPKPPPQLATAAGPKINASRCNKQIK